MRRWKNARGGTEEGPYAHVRHPLYASYLVALTGCLLATPHWINGAALLFIAHRLNGTAAREEARFLHSGLGSAYADYVRRTGRFVPCLRSTARTDPRERRRGSRPARDEAVAEGAHFTLEGRRIPVIGLEALLANKRATGRTQDLAHVEAIGSKHRDV